MSDIMQNAILLAQASPAAGTAAATAAPQAAQAAADGAQAAAGTADAAGSMALQAADAAATAAQQAGGLAQSLGEAASHAGAAAAPSMGFMHFIVQSDYVGKTLFVILICMSLITWYLIVVKALSNLSTRRRAAEFLNKFWNAGSLEQVENEISTHGARDPFSHLASHAMHARAHHAKYGATKLEEIGSNGEFVTRTMRKVIDEETAKLENGLTLLASVGSTAPFVGLFGTVWGVYHALVGIGLADGVTINRIAGPVGEALIMTGLGLAVAIPAVLAYNAFVRSNRVLLSRLDAFAHDLFAFLSTGQQVAVSDGKVRALRRTGAPGTKGNE